MEELLARIEAEKWHMTLDYVPTTDAFVCELAGRSWEGENCRKRNCGCDK